MGGDARRHGSPVGQRGTLPLFTSGRIHNHNAADPAGGKAALLAASQEDPYLQLGYSDEDDADTDESDAEIKPGAAAEGARCMRCRQRQPQRRRSRSGLACCPLIQLSPVRWSAARAPLTPGLPASDAGDAWVVGPRPGRAGNAARPP